MENTFERLDTLISEAFNDISKVELKTIRENGFKNVSVNEAHTVEAIGMYVPKTMSAVAKKLDITLGTLTVAVNHLVSKDLVIRTRSEIDKRVFLLSLTEKGKKLYKVHQRFHVDLVTSLVKNLSEREAEVIVQGFLSLNKFLEAN